jgi:hypothetical protein
MKISLTNSKLGDKIPSLNLPTTVCRANAPCKKGCYAMKGNWLFKNVVNSLQSNLDHFLQDSKGFFDDIINYINNDDITYKFFRWFSSGDIVNQTFLNGMVRVAERCKQTKFLCFTKKYELINEYLNVAELPKNLKIVLSAWDKDFKVDNPHNLPMTYINFKDQTRNADIPEFAIPCVGTCSKCKACWSLKKGQSVYFNQH